MRIRERRALLAVLLLAAAFAFTIVRSVLRRAETTYNYPAYSSLNNSNNGIKAYFEALRKLGFNAVRNFQPIHKLEGSGADIFYAGPNLFTFQYFEPKEFEQFERLARQGVRVIIAFDPEGFVNKRSQPPKREIVLKKRWGINVAYTKRDVNNALRRFMTELEVVPVTWHFASWSPEWNASEMRGGYPLFLERHFEKGSILLIANVGLFTNRELLLHPDAPVLAAVPGPHRDIVFDESHLGLEDTGTVVGLATAHGLEWMLVGFVVLAALYVWRNSASFVPPAPFRQDTAVAGRDAHSALSNLLMQSIPKESILRSAAEEWNRSLSRRRSSARAISGEELRRLSNVEPADAAREYEVIAQRANKSMIHSGSKA